MSEIRFHSIIRSGCAHFIDYKVLAFGFIPYSALAADNEGLHQLLLQLHGITALVLILLIIVHGIERGRIAFMDDGQLMKQNV